MTDKPLALPTVSLLGFEEFPLSEPGLSCRVSGSFESIGKDWEMAQPSRSIYLQRPVLKALEEAPPVGIRPSYLVFYKNGLPIGVAYCQLLHFKTDENVQDKTGSGALKSLTGKVKSLLAKQFDFHLLVCGNLLFTGEHGYHFDSSHLPGNQVAPVLEEALAKVQSFWKGKKIKTDGLFIKDIGEAQSECRQTLLDHRFRQFLFHPNMVLPIRGHWHSMEEYMADISSKYRVRARKAFKCGAPLHKIDLQLDQLETHKDHLYQLYKGVMETAGFNMVTLNENYIVRLKQNLGDLLNITAYYLDGEIVGYRTNIHNYGEIEAHFLGYDQRINKEYQLYMNMLLDSLRYGIEHRASRVVYARTAMEIKSTIGAVPEELYCYIRANNCLLNGIMPPILEYFRPADDWVQRNPFKED